MQTVFMGKSKNVANGNAAGSSELEDGNTYYDYIWDDNPSWPLLAAGKVNQTGWAPKTVLTNIITSKKNPRYCFYKKLWLMPFPVPLFSSADWISKIYLSTKFTANWTFLETCCFAPLLTDWADTLLTVCMYLFSSRRRNCWIPDLVMSPGACFDWVECFPCWPTLWSVTRGWLYFNEWKKNVADLYHWINSFVSLVSLWFSKTKMLWLPGNRGQSL